MRTRKLLSYPMYPLESLNNPDLKQDFAVPFNISKQTVDTHRKNMVHKKHLNNTGELIGKAIRNGWI